MRLAPARFDTSIVTAGRPSTLVMVVASLKVGLMVATSPRVTEAALEAATGMCKTSSGVSINAGTLTAKRPCGPSSAPAATRLFPCAATNANWSRETPRLFRSIGSAMISTASSRVPLRSAESTPVTCSMAFWVSRAI